MHAPRFSAPLSFGFECNRPAAGHGAACLFLLRLLVFLFAAFSAPAQTRVGSAVFRRSASAAGPSSAAIISGNGRAVAFLSAANNLVTNDDRSTSVDVFVRDLPSVWTTLASVNLSGVGGGNDHSSAPGFSDDARFIVFESAASNLVAGDTNGVSDIFVRDLVNNETRLVSVPVTGLGNADGPSSAPLISADGRWVFFESAALNLVTAPSEPGSQLYARDLTAGVTVLVSDDTTAAGAAPGSATGAAITLDGRFAAFTKRATQTVNGVLSRGEIYLRDRQSGVTTWASAHVSRFTQSSYTCVNAALSADGHFILFRVTPDAQGPGLLLWRDLRLDETALVDPGAFVQDWPSLSADGRFAAYGTTNGVFLWDAQLPGTQSIGANVVSPAVACTLPVLSADATRLAYVWTSNGAPTVVVYDRTNETRQVASLTTNGLPGVTGHTLPVLSPDGRKLVFEAIDSRLVAEDWNRETDVFLHDLVLHETQLVSRRHSDRPALTAAASTRAFAGSLNAAGTHAAYLSYDDDFPTPSTNRSGLLRVQTLATRQLQQFRAQDRGLYDPMLSADGRYVAFSSVVRHLNEPTTDGAIFWYDLTTGSNGLVAQGIYWPSEGLAPSTGPTDRTLALSGDGLKLAFQSSLMVSNFVPSIIGEGNGGPDIFVRDLRTGSNQLVSIRMDGSGTAFGDSTYPVFSPDGRWVVFQNAAGGITTHFGPGLYARDLVEQKSLLLAANGSRPSFSADSRFVVYSTGSAGSELFDLYAGTNSVVCSDCDSPSVSAHGQWVAYRWSQPGRPVEIYVKDMQNDQVEWISVNLTGGTNVAQRPSRNPIISHDGRYVIFASTATDLVPNDTNGVSDIFVRDRFRAITFLASANLHGTQAGNGSSILPVLAADGRTVLFTSDANDLVEGDYNEGNDVFILRLGGPDTDHDGLDDDWELAYFNTLDRDGTNDFDGDGQSDKAEFATGTDPTNAGSILRVRTITALGGAGTKVDWDSIAGRTYRVQWKQSINDPLWADVGDKVVASGATAQWTDVRPAAAQGFYRAVLVP